MAREDAGTDGSLRRDPPDAFHPGYLATLDGLTEAETETRVLRGESVVDEIAERSEGSVLVTRDPSPSRRFSVRVGRWLQGVSAAVTGQSPETEEPQQIRRELEADPSRKG